MFACHVNYTVASQHSTSFTADISIENTGSLGISSWSLTWTWSGNQKLTGATNAKYFQSGENVTLTNASSNGTINTGATLTGISFTAKYSGTNSAPSEFYVNGTLCQ